MLVLGSYPDYFAAHLDKSILIEAGIESVLLDEHTITTNWLYSQGLGGIKLAVDEADFLRAQDLLEAAHLSKENFYDEVPPLDEDDESALDPANKICTNCGSRNTSSLGYSKRAAYLGFLLWGFPIIAKRETWHCFHCGKEFKS